MIGQVEPQPHQRHRHDQDPGRGQQAGRQGFAPPSTRVSKRINGQLAKARMAPQSNADHERRHHPQAGTQQRQQQNLHQQAIIVDHGGARSTDQFKVQAVGRRSADFKAAIAHPGLDQRLAPGFGLGAAEAGAQGAVEVQAAGQQVTQVSGGARSG
jgi:hypothetical protein